MVRKARQVEDPSEIGRGEHRDSPDNVLIGFSCHPAEAISCFGSRLKYLRSTNVAR